MLRDNNSNLVTVANDDYLFVQQLTGRKVQLKNFKKTLSATIYAEGQTRSVELKPSGYDFLVKDIQIYAFCSLGNFMPNGVARDLVTLTLKDLKTDNYWVDAGTDIQAFSSINNRGSITPTILSRDTGLRAEFTHIRKVSDYCADFPRQGTNFGSISGLTFSYGLQGGLTPDPFPIDIQLILSGAKIFPQDN